jgi:hypothetical protein
MSGLDVAGANAWGELGRNCGQLLETMPKPTIAAVAALRSAAAASSRSPAIPRVGEGEVRPA